MFNSQIERLTITIAQEMVHDLPPKREADRRSFEIRRQAKNLEDKEGLASTEGTLTAGYN